MKEVYLSSSLNIYHSNSFSSYL